MGDKKNTLIELISVKVFFIIYNILLSIMFNKIKYNIFYIIITRNMQYNR